MAEKKTTPVVIDDVEYAFEDMTDEQQTFVNHVADLDRKIRSTQFNLDQLNVGRQAFINLLKSALEKASPEEPEVVNG
jgi:cobalamin biosynthesis Co2+ chelatase CbiK